ncbi:gamma-glutamyltransferase [Chondromyces apiculatus]|uniref:Gamma-glutamyltranspeptidase n=1 Tax=Chondromyces apiculatus DSM 436 TaxID=1192034 RepID=A0A017T844_9BACT|nr:gamma-glutamyltransferase [Chondromyces apiculatus]EYF05122.1 Gamma-glutamyltranspeptidase [Chondromyces apiculatus DSM 436]
MADLSHYEPRPHLTQSWHLAKPAARGRRGVCASQSRAAAEAGAAVLEAGGNAADAAVAAAFALAAVEPWSSGIGGIGFAVVHRAGAREAQVVDFGPVAPAGVDPAAYPLTGRMKRDLFTWPEVVGDRNVHGPLSFVIPSAVAGYDLLRERFGTGMPLADLLGPAIALARRGLPQDWLTTLKIAAQANLLRLYPESARIYLPDGLPPVAPYQGGLCFFQLGQIAETLERLRDGGLRDFYEGGVASDMVVDIQAMGGLLGAGDLAGYRATVHAAEPLDWRGRYTVHAAGGLTAAPTLARVMDTMRDAPIGPAPDAAWFRALSRAMRGSYAARLSGLGAGAGVQGASATPSFGGPSASTEPPGTCTTHLTVADGEGTMIALTSTLLSSMGSRVVLPRTGVLMNNGVMWFDPTPGSPNAIRPGARPLCNMCPIVVSERDGEGPLLAAGSSGGRRILASVYQTLAFSLDFGMTPEDAAHAPRIDVLGPDLTSADHRLPADVLEALAADGALEVVEHVTAPERFACPNLIRRDGEVLMGITDVMSPWSAAVAAAEATG